MSMLQLLADASEKINPSDIGIKDPVKNADTALSGLLNVTYTWAGVICVAIIVIAGFLYVTSDGNATKIKRAKDAIMGAVIGLIIIMLAFVLTNFVIGRF